MTTELTRQSAFETALKHMIAQGIRSQDNGLCVYRSLEGLKCAIGALIPDEFYIAELEASGIGGLCYLVDSNPVIDDETVEHRIFDDDTINGYAYSLDERRHAETVKIDRDELRQAIGHLVPLGVGFLRSLQRLHDDGGDGSSSYPFRTPKFRKRVRDFAHYWELSTDFAVEVA